MADGRPHPKHLEPRERRVAGLDLPCASVSPLVKRGAGPWPSRSVGVPRARRPGRFRRRSAHRAPPPSSLRGGRAHERRGRRGPAAGRGGAGAGARRRRRNPAEQRRQLVWDPPLGRRPLSAPGAPAAVDPPPAGEWPGSGRASLGGGARRLPAAGAGVGARPNAEGPRGSAQGWGAGGSRVRWAARRRAWARVRLSRVCVVRHARAPRGSGSVSPGNGPGPRLSRHRVFTVGQDVRSEPGGVWISGSPCAHVSECS